MSEKCYIIILVCITLMQVVKLNMFSNTVSYKAQPFLFFTHFLLGFFFGLILSLLIHLEFILECVFK